MDTGNDSRSTLATHAQRLRERTDAICRFSGGVPTVEEEIHVFRDYCEDYGMWLDAPVDLFTQPDAHGDEHEVWFVDTHQGNLIRTDTHVMVPIDFRIQPVSGAILDGVRKMIFK